MPASEKDEVLYHSGLHKGDPDWVFRKEDSERLWGNKVRDAMAQVLRGINDGRSWIAECPDLDFDIIVEVRKQPK